MPRHIVTTTVRGPWSLDVSRRFWENFTPAALPAGTDTDELHTVFLVDADWSRAGARVTQRRSQAHVTVEGAGDLDAAAAQVGRFLCLDTDATAWPEVGERDDVIAAAQRELPGLRPCGFHSPYEAAVWSVLSQRVRMTQAASLRQRLIDEHGDDGALPPPERLRRLPLDLPGRKAEYLSAVADAALDGRLDGATLHAGDPTRAMAELQDITGVGPFAAELIVLRGATAPDALPTHERRLDAAVEANYGEGTRLADVAEAWRPFRTWAAFHLRAMAGWSATAAKRAPSRAVRGSGRPDRPGAG